MCKSEKMMRNSSLPSTMILHLFKASLLFVALLSIIYVNFSVLVVVSSLLFPSIVFTHKKMRLLQTTKKLSENEILTRKDLQTSGERIVEDTFEIGATFCDSLGSSISEDLEEDYLIEIALQPERNKHKLEEEGTEDFISDLNEFCGEDNLIEIDISMGSIRQSVPVC
ncbi:hypothetical protein ACP275_13G107500 [Erythranthe tilingii]